MTAAYHEPSVTASASRRLAEHTTTRVGGAAHSWVTARTTKQAVEILQDHRLPTAPGHVSAETDQTGEASDVEPRPVSSSAEQLLILGGGSNMIVDDAGFPGTVLHLAMTGAQFTEYPSTAENSSTAESHVTGENSVTEEKPARSYDPAEVEAVVLVRVAAGHDWDELVAATVDAGLTGLETLSGIPGSTGATPVQNVGAYGSDVSETLHSVEAFDRVTGELITLTNSELDFGYRSSLLKRSSHGGSPRYVVLSVVFELTRRADRLSAPIRYADIARALGVAEFTEPHQRRASLAEVRQQVLNMRANKGMVLDPEDPDTYSTGSFFTNPIVREETVLDLPKDCPQFPAGIDDDGAALVKLSAAWLIEHAGCAKGFGAELVDGRASLSTKHTLAVTNRGSATSADLLTVAAAARDKVRTAFDVELHPEPVLIGCSLDERPSC